MGATAESSDLVHEVAGLLSQFNQKRDADWPTAEDPFADTIAVKAGQLANITAEALGWFQGPDGRSNFLDNLIGSLFQGVIGWCIQTDKHGSNEASLNALANAFDQSGVDSFEVVTNITACLQAAQALSVAAAVQDLPASLQAFRDLAYSSNTDLRFLRNQYIGRVVLQFLKHRNGIASNAYVDFWEGKPDHRHIAELIQSNPGMSFSSVLNTIDQRYRQLIPF